MSEAFENVTKDSPRLLFHDTAHGNGIISYASRVYSGLPHDLIPIEINSIGRVGHDILIGAVSMGFSEIFILADPKKHSENELILPQIKIAESLMEGLKFPSKDRFIIIQTDDPEEFSEIISKRKHDINPKPSPFIPIGTPRSMVRIALQGLAKENKIKETIFTLPENSPYGKIEIDKEKCTLCLACVSVCPSGSLQDNPELPQLLFREESCLQCGLCVKTCPENVLSLKPQLNIAEDAFSNELLNEDEPFPCTNCGKIFGTKKSIESIKKRLASHSMFNTEGKEKLLFMCEDCRVESQFSYTEKLLDVGERPKTRTTDDYN